MRVCGKNVFNETDIKKISKVYLSNKFKDTDIINKIKENKVKYIAMDQREMDKMLDHNQGIIFEMSDYEYKTMDEISDDKMVLVLDHLEDPHNFGAIIRTCEAKGIKNIIIPKDRSVTITETVVKTSTGALNHVNIIMVTNLAQCLRELKKRGFFVYAADMDGTDYKKVDYADQVALVIGSEGFGISNVVKKECDVIVSIPMRGHVNSLNASVSAAILIYGIGE